MALLVTRGVGNDNGASSLVASAGLGISIGVIVSKILRFSLNITTLLNFIFDRNKCKC